MALPCVRLGVVRLRSGALLRCLCRSSSHQAVTAAEEIDIPRRKTWDKTAVLQALAYTVNHDPTAASYVFQDDPYLIPSTSTDYKLYSMSKESGKNAAKYIVNMYPNLFQKDIAEPHIPCLMPENIQPQIESVSEEALNERMKLRRVKESIDLFDQLLQGGTTPSLETTNKLLDLLCFYGDREPSTDDQEDNESENVKRRNVSMKSIPAGKTWKENNNAERIFNLMPERNAHSYCTMIRGMVKHGAYAQAFNMYTELLNNRLTGDVWTFNALILAAPETKKEMNEKSALIVDLLNHMVQQNVKPNLLTFNSVMKSLRKMGSAVKGMAMQTLMEMKALNIEPSLSTYSHLLGVFYKPGDLLSQSQLLASILEQVRGKSFTAKDPDDLLFFSEAMRVCLEAKDLDLAYDVHRLLNTGDNWRLVGKPTQEIAYYGRLFNIVCMMENVDMVLKWYRELVPSRYYPTSRGFQNLLQVLEMENRLELIPKLWKDIKIIGHGNKEYLLEEILNLMASGKRNAELQTAFADTAVSIKSVYDSSENSRIPLKASAAAFGNIAILLSRAGRLEEAWKILSSFKVKHLVPRPNVITEVLDAAKAAENRAVAMDLVQLAVSFSLPDTAQIAQRVLNDFTLTEEQRITLQDLTQSSGTSSSSSSSSDSDHD
ncbi:pentatricopeptide repeat domain-containing protein 3, mitochondrial isoform X1 [Hyla sarda]|uniref:pentatricopeptide repeat domain-containing protein 3, mitochondrial isoform X1 n=2 Tax=Hyla sarda TaxID=327740 RepID=UPI0024C3E257|nr:pentatricopeptide repeat domain-containing protein 3, mitochondrial isoform X1 [Hyla sarda]